MTDMQVLQSLLREDFYYFVRKVFNELHSNTAFIDAWHVRAICYALTQVMQGEYKRLLITVPPRHLKSICTSVALPAFILGHDPTQKAIVASYGADLATKHAGDFKQIVEAEWYLKLFPAMDKAPLKNTSLQYTTKDQGLRYAVSLGGSVTGFGADMLIIDDMMKAQDARSEVEREKTKDYYDQTLFSRLNDKSNGSIIAIQQRLHEDDLAGYLLEEKGFHHLNLPSIAQEPQTIHIGANKLIRRKTGDILFPERESQEVLAKIQHEIGTYTFSAQYLQNPTPIDGARINWGEVATYDHNPDPTAYQFVVQSWDTAMSAEKTSDYSACLTWGYRDGFWDLIDVYRAKLDYRDLEAKVRAMNQSYGVNLIIIENAATGKILLQNLRANGFSHVKGYTPRIDKLTRFEAEMAKMMSGNYRIPDTAPFLLAFKRELSSFPNSKYDDQVDALSQFLHWSGSRKGQVYISTNPNTGRRRRPRPSRRRR